MLLPQSGRAFKIVSRSIHIYSVISCIHKRSTESCTALYRQMSTKSSPTIEVNYNNRVFRSASNTPNGEVSSATLFLYHQDTLPSTSTAPATNIKPIVWATYSGGSIARGFLIATVQNDNSLDARYEHVNTSGDLMTGKCHSTPEVLPDGRLKLHEKWEWTSGDRSKGESIVEEVLKQGTQ